MEIKTGQSPVYSAKPVKQGNANFGAQVSARAHEKKTEDVQERTPFGAEVSAQAKKTDQAPESAAVTAKRQLNQSILQASLDVSLSAGNEPMSLLLKTAIEGVNKELEGELGANAIQNAYDSGIDVSPQATADRIVQMSTAFFDKYHANHKDLSVDDALKSFTELIGKGIDKGFKEARDILGGLGVLDHGDIGKNIDATYELVQKGLQAFVENYKKPGVATADTST
ncbi:MAG: DUF5610 domain-containing protein [Methylobacter sp.]|nr:DUF5610 domain-containing protein [Methylobacter sp.]MDP2097420.1 DUF5610 domain-containing protein [Methylobacter sp.]MDP2428616.1 DUF5610 domain-containing protein [Methylobacter sp.]MDP3056452.1 DUF5610 domain-containing protein [Methylobacter sp.]MDP3363198.1 DUF5610 domain-containing protein [Methylobacter sp.]